MVVAQYVKQPQDQCSFDMIGNLYFRKDRRSVETRTFRVFKEMGWNFSLKMPIFAGEYGKEKPPRTASSGRFIARAHTVGTTVHYERLHLVTNLELTPAHRFQRTPIYLGAQTSPHSDLLRTLPH